MIKQTTNGIMISVECYYQQEYSNPANAYFMFAYRITIQNNSDYTSKLTHRHWDNVDSIGDPTVVDGEGVVGEEAFLAPGKSHQYTSGCNLKSEMGNMEGYYPMSREIDGSVFEVKTPRFNLIASY